MGERLTGNFDQNHVDGFETMQDEGKADSYSEAVRRASTVGLQQMGYVNGQKEPEVTPLQRNLHKLANAFFWVGIALIGATLWYPVGFRIVSVAPLISAGVLYSLEGFVEAKEPAVSKKLKQLLERESA